MYRIIVGLMTCLGVAAGTYSAGAADLPVKARPPAVVVAYSWTGLYVGGHVGYGWADKDWSDPLGPPFAIGSHTATGWLAGAQVGFNYQFGSWVIGAEGQFS